MSHFETSLILNSFDPISLEEMEAFMLMDRLETKFVFSVAKLPEILDCLKDNYRILEIQNLRNFPYHTTYLDTSDYFFFTQQIRGKLNRHKIRYRIYEQLGTSFLEIKIRTNKNRTVKWRIENSLNPNCFDPQASSFLKGYIPDNRELKPVLINGFYRISLVGKNIMERITLDSNIYFSDPGEVKSEFPFMAIAEVKSEKFTCNSPICKVMKKFSIPPNGFSKYCIGSVLVKDMPRINMLKPKLRLIKKLENEYIKST